MIRPVPLGLLAAGLPGGCGNPGTDAPRPATFTERLP